MRDRRPNSYERHAKGNIFTALTRHSQPIQEQLASIVGLKNKEVLSNSMLNIIIVRNTCIILRLTQ